MLQLVMAGVVAPDDPGLGDLMGYMAAAAGRCLANSWTLAPATPTVVSDLVSGLLWLSVSGKLGEGMAETLAAGARISHHHGIGLERARWMPDELGQGLEVMRSLQRSLDPAGIMNPDKVLKA